MTQKTINLAFILFLFVSFFSCSSKNNNSNTEKEAIINKKVNKTIVDTFVLEVKKEETYKTFQYICPQADKEGNSDKEGNCPICEMELIENPDFTK